jgi:hypothetical protein
MTRRNFLRWGQTWHHPFLVLASDQVLRYGKTHYEQASREMIQLASVRIARWNERIALNRVDTAIQQVDEMLRTRSTDTTNRLIVERV